MAACNVTFCTGPPVLGLEQFLRAFHPKQFTKSCPCHEKSTSASSRNEHDTASYNAFPNFPGKQASQNPAPATKHGSRSSPHAAPATKSEHLQHQCTNMRQPVTMRFPIFQESKLHKMRRLPRKVEAELHQMLRLPRKVNTCGIKART